MTPIAILKAARAKIADPAAWCQGTFARRADGLMCTTTHPDAVSWCAAGAIHAAAVDDRHDSYRQANIALRAVTGPVGIFNDHATHAEVLAAFDEAIRRLENS